MTRAVRVLALVLVACAHPPARSTAPAWSTGLNLGFEQVDTAGKPVGWTSKDLGLLAVDAAAHGGARALRVTPGGAFGSASAAIPADQVRGKIVVVRGWVRTVDSGGAGLWLRAKDASGAVLAIDAMSEHLVVGTTAWAEATVLVEIPIEAVEVAFGVHAKGTGQAWFDDLSISVREPLPTPPIALAGSLTDASGVPVEGGVVAVNSSGGWSPKATTRTGRGGAFSVEVPPGEYALTATGPGGSAVYVPIAEYAAPRRDLALRLGTGGITVRGTVTGVLRPASRLVQVTRFSDVSGDIFCVPLDADGGFRVSLLTAEGYGLSIDAPDLLVDPITIGGAADAEVSLPVTQLAPPPDEVVAFARAAAIPLATVEAGHGFADLAPLDQVIGDARVVGLGEATHGTREFFQMKHRLLEYLVAEKGFTVFAIEAYQPEARALNAYVLGGPGDPRALIGGLDFWTWNTEEVLALVEWMRAWNADPRHAKVQFTGFDMQGTVAAFANLRAFLDQVDPAAAGLLAPLAALESIDGLVAFDRRPDADRAAIVKATADLGLHLDAHREAYVKRAGVQAFDDARHDVTIMAQAIEMFTASSSSGQQIAIRDRAMADNVMWLLDHHPKGTRFVLWAHNGHVGRSDSYDSMGVHLARRLGAEYLPIGFVFGEGGFQAIRDSRGLGEVTIGPPSDFDLAQVFLRAGLGLAFLDLRAARGPVAAYFADRHPMREYGAGYNPESSPLPVRLSARFDAVIFVAKSTRARGLAR